MLTQHRGAASIQLAYTGGGGRTAGVVVDFYPSAAQMTAGLGRHVKHVGVCLGGLIHGILAGQLEVKLRRLVAERLGIVDRCFDCAVNKEDNFVISLGQFGTNVMSIRIRSDDLLKIAS